MLRINILIYISISTYIGPDGKGRKRRYDFCFVFLTLYLFHYLPLTQARVKATSKVLIISTFSLFYGIGHEWLIFS